MADDIRTYVSGNNTQCYSHLHKCGYRTAYSHLHMCDSVSSTRWHWHL